MSHQAVLTPNAPKPIGPYSQAIQAGGMVFCSGQIPLDPKTGQLSGTTVQDQAKVVLTNLKAVLEQAGVSLNHVVKTTIFIKNMEDFPKVNEVYGTFFTGIPPARSTVEVSRLPKDVLIEIEAIAIR